MFAQMRSRLAIDTTRFTIGRWEVFGTFERFEIEISLHRSSVVDDELGRSRRVHPVLDSETITPTRFSFQRNVSLLFHPRRNALVTRTDDRGA